MGRLDWLVARPIAHRGLHDIAIGVVENTPSAVSRAVEHGYGVEIDVRLSADGEAVVFHDATLDRLTEASGPVSALTVAELRRVVFRATGDRIWTLDECLDLVAGRQALVVEIKSGFDADMRLAERTADVLKARGGPVVAESFDPRVLVELRKRAPDVPRGVVGEAFSDDSSYWVGRLTRLQRIAARSLLHWPASRPDFLSWDVDDLSRGSVRLARANRVPVTSWTVHTPEEQARAALYADQMVFEGFLP